MGGTVLYDEECEFCRGVVRFTMKHDSRNRMRYVGVQSEEGRRLVIKTGLPEKDTNTVIYFTEKKISIRSAAVLYILKEMDGGWKIFFILIIIPKFLRDFFYRLIARNRYMFISNKTGLH